MESNNKNDITITPVDGEYINPRIDPETGELEYDGVDPETAAFKPDDIDNLNNNTLKKEK
ncbi:MAG: hypothetical protein OEY79_01640 [Anaplasmataceae bacterium]|nr:hypothetical protein [Anaplasmataceae bacterium]